MNCVQTDLNATGVACGAATAAVTVTYPAAGVYKGCTSPVAVRQKASPAASDHGQLNVCKPAQSKPLQPLVLPHLQRRQIVTVFTNPKLSYREAPSASNARRTSSGGARRAAHRSAWSPSAAGGARCSLRGITRWSPIPLRRLTNAPVCARPHAHDLRVDRR